MGRGGGRDKWEVGTHGRVGHGRGGMGMVGEGWAWYWRMDIVGKDTLYTTRSIRMV